MWPTSEGEWLRCQQREEGWGKFIILMAPQVLESSGHGTEHGNWAETKAKK